MSQIHLEPVPPYDFSLSARIFSTGDPAIRIYDNGVYRHALDIQGSPALIEVRSIGTPDNPLLDVTATPVQGGSWRKMRLSRASLHQCSIFTMTWHRFTTRSGKTR